MQAKKRLEELRKELRAGQISYGELAELQSLAAHIEPEDVELLEAAGVPEDSCVFYAFDNNLEENTEPTTVIFRKYKEGDIIALFPYEKEGPHLCTCYQHTGQHGAADGPGVVGDTKPATPEEYADLKKELEGIGYVLDVRKRINYNKYLKSNK